MSALERLAAISACSEAAVEGPWVPDGSSVYKDLGDGGGLLVADLGLLDVAAPTALFVAHARTDVPALVAALRAAIAEHPTTELRVDGESFETCMVCLTTYPCPTVRAIEEALT